MLHLEKSDQVNNQGQMWKIKKNYYVPSTQNTSLSNDKALLNILEGLLADNIEPQQPTDLQFRQSLGENSNSQLKGNTTRDKKDRMEGKFVSKNVLNL